MLRIRSFFIYIYLTLTVDFTVVNIIKGRQSGFHIIHNFFSVWLLLSTGSRVTGLKKFYINFFIQISSRNSICEVLLTRNLEQVNMFTINGIFFVVISVELNEMLVVFLWFCITNNVNKIWNSFLLNFTKRLWLIPFSLAVHGSNFYSF